MPTYRDPYYRQPRMSAADMLPIARMAGLVGPDARTEVAQRNLDLNERKFGLTVQKAQAAQPKQAEDLAAVRLNNSRKEADNAARTQKIADEHQRNTHAAIFLNVAAPHLRADDPEFDVKLRNYITQLGVWDAESHPSVKEWKDGMFKNPAYKATQARTADLARKGIDIRDYLKPQPHGVFEGLVTEGPDGLNEAELRADKRALARQMSTAASLPSDAINLKIPGGSLSVKPDAMRHDTLGKLAKIPITDRERNDFNKLDTDTRAHAHGLLAGTETVKPGEEEWRGQLLNTNGDPDLIEHLIKREVDIRQNAKANQLTAIYGERRYQDTQLRNAMKEKLSELKLTHKYETDAALNSADDAEAKQHTDNAAKILDEIKGLNNAIGGNAPPPVATTLSTTADPYASVTAATTAPSTGNAVFGDSLSKEKGKPVNFEVHPELYPPSLRNQKAMEKSDAETKAKTERMRAIDLTLKRFEPFAAPDFIAKKRDESLRGAEPLTTGEYQAERSVDTSPTSEAYQHATNISVAHYEKALSEAKRGLESAGIDPATAFHTLSAMANGQRVERGDYNGNPVPVIINGDTTIPILPSGPLPPDPVDEESQIKSDQANLATQPESSSESQ